MGTVHNIHQRILAAPAEVVGPLLDRLGGADDILWPASDWPPMILDRPVAVGARGGHGPIRYRVSAFEPGRRVRFTVDPDVGLDGYHEATITALDAERCVLRHVIRGRLRGRMRLLWPLAVRWLHDAVVEDLLDNAERAAAQATGTRPPLSSQWSLWVRLLRRAQRPRSKAVAVPAHARLAAAAFPARDDDHDIVDFADAFRVRRTRGTPLDPTRWAHAIFFDPPRWVTALLVVRNALVGGVGIERGDASAFATVATAEDEVLLGSDAGHLNFRASVLVEPSAVTLTTLVQINNRRGRLYMAVVRRVHPVVVRSMLSRAARRLTGTDLQDRAGAVAR